jgi:(1->4)-alpha-D-glucan 1-alpha-D-glucosylmutase
MIPRATYRVQFGKTFGFDDAAALAPYLAQLGISHLYASPYLQARSNSKHGYDITDHNSLNSELGGYHAFQRMVRAFRENGLEHILDYVPNHMGVGGADNPLWLDVLEWGENSRYARWFDVEWNAHPEYLNGKLLVPFLAEQYGAELEAGHIELKFDAEHGEFNVWLYGTHKLPVSPLTYPEMLSGANGKLQKLAEEFAALANRRTELASSANRLKSELAQRVATNDEVRSAVDGVLQGFRGTAGDLRSWSALDALIQQQYWRPSHFRVAADDINYRRFFNISELAGVRMELPEVFEHTHRLVFELLKEGSLEGLRIDHVDGLLDPKEYLERLRARAGPSLYLVVEKILAHHENLREDWPVEGTTGYEFCGQVTGLLVDGTAEDAFTRFYREFTGEWQAFPEIVRECKIKIMENEMRSELEALSRDAVRVARQDPRTTDFTQNILCRALKETIACFPVYRTYVDGARCDETDERYIHWAITQATKNEQEVDASVFAFLEKLLGGKLAGQPGSGFDRQTVIRCAMKAQQFSGPVMAKGLEDTAFYRYNRFVARNEVGSSPEQFAVPLGSFHKANQVRAEKWPHTLLATSTHDTKRGEDARARLAALSLVPEEWAAKVASWSRILRARRGDVEGTAPPARNDEYLFFQNLIASWPAELCPPLALESTKLAEYKERLQAAMTKSLREARVRSNWISPDTAYESAVTEFIRDALNPEVSGTFLENFLPFEERIVQMGVHNSLVQLVLKSTSPGVPDFYQGSELWDLNLTDPDNRRPVDFAMRRHLLERVREISATDRASSMVELFRNWHDGRVKLALIAALLNFRRGHGGLFEGGAYEPLSCRDCAEARICAYLRIAERDVCLVVASLDARLQSQDYRGIKLDLGTQAGVARWRDVITGATLHAEDGAMDVAELFASLPVAVLTPITGVQATPS